MDKACDYELLSGYIDGELSEAEEVAVRVHLSECSECHSLYAALQRNRKLIHRHPQIAPSPGVRERLARRLDRDVLVVSRRIQRETRRRVAIALAAAAAILLLLSAFVAIPALIRHMNHVEQPEYTVDDKKPAPRVPPVPDIQPKVTPEEKQLVEKSPGPAEERPAPEEIPAPEEPEETVVARAPKEIAPEEKTPAPKETPEAGTPKSQLANASGTAPVPEQDPRELAMAEEKNKQFAAAEQKLEDGLAGGDITLQIQAIRDLGKVDHPKTYGKLRDVIIVGNRKYDVSVRREGVLSCGELSTEEGVKIIFAIPSSDDAAVNDARIDALALVRDEETLKFLANALKPGDKSIRFATPDGRRLIAVTLGGSGAAFTVEILLDALRKTPEKHFELRGAIITALGRIRQPQAVNQLSKILSSTKSDVVRLHHRMLAAESLGLIGGRLADEALLKALKRRQSDYVKATITRALGNSRAVPAIDPLVKLLGHSSNIVRSAAFEALGKITGQSHKSLSSWKKWWKKSKKDYSKPENIDSPGLTSQSVFRYSEIPLYEENVVFVLDASKSMEENGKASWLLADAERAINKLGAGAQFNVICFNDQVHMIKPNLFSATTENKRLAIEFCKRWIGNPSSLGPTDAAKALSTAIALSPSLIVYASDGLSSGGDKLEQTFPTITARRLVRELGWSRGRPKLNRPRIHVAGYFIPRGTATGPSQDSVPVGETPRALRILAGETGGAFCYSWFEKSPLGRDLDKQGNKK